MEQADLRAPDRDAARDVAAAPAHHALHGALHGGAGRRRARPRERAHRREPADRRGEAQAQRPSRRDLRHTDRLRRRGACRGAAGPRCAGRRRGRGRLRPHGRPARGFCPRPAALALPAGRARTARPRERDLHARSYQHGGGHARGPQAGPARTGARRARPRHGSYEGRRHRLRGAPRAPAGGHLPQAARRDARRRLCPVLRRGALGQRLRALAQERPARHARERERL